VQYETPRPHESPEIPLAHDIPHSVAPSLVHKHSHTAGSPKAQADETHEANALEIHPGMIYNILHEDHADDSTDRIPQAAQNPKTKADEGL
jgi:hypothetical protein